MKNFKTSLSRQEIFEISNEISINFAPIKPLQIPVLDTDLKLSRKKLLEISQNISLYYAPSILSNGQKLVVLPIDPQHLYVYWDLGDNQDYALSKSMFNNELTLRVYSQSEGRRYSVQTDPLVDIPVQNFQSRQTIRLPVAKKSIVYSASIGKKSSNKNFVPLVDSNTTYAIQGTMGENSNMKNEGTSVDNTNTAFVDHGKGSNRHQSVYVGTNNSGKGKKR